MCKRMCVLHITDQHLTHSSTTENRLGGEGDEEGGSVRRRNLTQTLQGIYDVIVSHKGTSVDFINREVSQKPETEAQCEDQQLITLSVICVF